MREAPLYVTPSLLWGVPEVREQDDCSSGFGFLRNRDASLSRKRIPLGPYRSPMPRNLGGSWGGGRFLMGEVHQGAHEPPAKYNVWSC